MNCGSLLSTTPHGGLLKKKPINTQFVDEDIMIDVKSVNAGAFKMMLVNSGAPLSIVSSKWFEEYLKDAKVDEEDIERQSCVRRFRLGKTLYMSYMEVTFQVVMKTDCVKRDIVSNVIDSEEVNFLCGRKTKEK